MTQLENSEKLAPVTEAARFGSSAVQGASVPITQPIYQNTVYTFDDLESMMEVMNGEKAGYTYYRIATPNQTEFETGMAQLENAEAALACGSGMGAIFAAISAVVKTGDHIIADTEIYGGSYILFTQQLPRFGIETTFVNMRDPEAIRAAYRPGHSRILFFETLTNPLLSVGDLPGLVAIAKELNLLTYVDATFTTPIVSRPLDYGIDVVTHATTKYIGGHSDALGGIAAGKREIIDQARIAAGAFGLTGAPFDAWLNVRSLKTLPLRMAAHSRNALQVAQFLESHPRVESVNYPCLESHPQYALAKKLMPNGCSGMLSFNLKGGFPQAVAFGKAIKGIPFAPSLADVSTTLSHPASTSHRALPPEQRQAMGIGDGLLRLSVGIEDPQDLINELKAALDSLD